MLLIPSSLLAVYFDIFPMSTPPSMHLVPFRPFLYQLIFHEKHLPPRDAAFQHPRVGRPGAARGDTCLNLQRRKQSKGEAI
jgi:hypothetical protein